MAEVAVIAAVRPRRIPENELERIGRRAHVEVKEPAAGLHERGAVLVVVLQTVAGDMLAPDNALAQVHVAGEGETSDTVAFGANRLAGVQEGENQIVDALVVGEIDDRSGAADDQHRVIPVDAAHRLFAVPVVILQQTDKLR